MFVVLALLIMSFTCGLAFKLLSTKNKKPVVSFDRSSLVSKSYSPLISGRAENISALQVDIRPITSGVATDPSMSNILTVHTTVYNNQWSVLAAMELGSSFSLAPGSYEITVRGAPDGEILASDTLRIYADQSTSGAKSAVMPTSGVSQTGAMAFTDLSGAQKIPVVSSSKKTANDIKSATQLAYTDFINTLFPKVPIEEGDVIGLRAETVETQFQTQAIAPAGQPPTIIATSSADVKTIYPPSCTMTVRPAVIAPGQSATVSWWSINTDTVSLSLLGAVKTSGSVTVKPTTSTAYKGFFTGAGGITHCGVFLSVDPNLHQVTQSSQDVGIDTSATDSSCGIGHDLDIALVLDKSLSIDRNELAQMKNAFSNFVDLFLPDHPTLFSVTDFGTHASVQQPFTGDLASIKHVLQNVVTSGYTNWEDGLIKAKSTFDPRAGVPNLIIFASDGNPNESSGGHGEQAALDAAISVANTIKAGGTRIITLGIGNEVGNSALNPNNLRAISSDNSYFNASTFGELATVLQKVAYNLCTTGAGNTGPPPPSPEVSFFVTPIIVRSGNTVTVSWAGRYVRTCTVTGTNGDMWRSNGGSEVSSLINEKTTYTLQCIGLNNSSVTKTAVVNIVPAYFEF
jgi:hypothetical protein